MQLVCAKNYKLEPAQLNITCTNNQYYILISREPTLISSKHTVVYYNSCKRLQKLLLAKLHSAKIESGHSD